MITGDSFIDLINDSILPYNAEWGGHIDLFNFDFENKTGFLVVSSYYYSKVKVPLDSILSYIVDHHLEDTLDNEQLIVGNLERLIAKTVETFSADEEFNKLYDEFVLDPNHHLTSTEFLKYLQYGEECFKDLASIFRQVSKGIPDFKDAN